MAQPEKKASNEKVIYTKYLGADNKIYKGEFVALGSGNFAIRLSEQKIKEEMIREKTSESRVVSESKLRPAGNLGSADKKKRQDAIDKYLDEEGVSPLEAIQEITVGKGAKAVKKRKIEADLKFEVEYYLKEERKNFEVPIERLSETVSFKEVKQVPQFVKLQAFQFRKCLINIINNL
jgi:hypothetical protein